MLAQITILLDEVDWRLGHRACVAREYGTGEQVARPPLERGGQVAGVAGTQWQEVGAEVRAHGDTGRSIAGYAIGRQAARRAKGRVRRFEETARVDRVCLGFSPALLFQ